MAQDRQTDFEVAAAGALVTFQPISSPARQWCIDSMPDGIFSTDGLYSVGSKQAAKLREEIEAEGFAVNEVEMADHG